MRHIHLYATLDETGKRRCRIPCADVSNLPEHIQLQLRGDVHTDANADFHQLRSLEICATQLLSSSQLV